MKILMTGATGLVGKELGKRLVHDGHSVVVVTRDADKARLEIPFLAEYVEVDLMREKIPSGRIEGVEAVIHLAGENVAGGYWTRKMKERILQSRVRGTRHLVDSLPPSVKHFISASAIGIYGDRADEVVSEESARGEGFLSDVCEQWEAEAAKAKARVVFVRTGVVLAAHGGALQKMLFAFKAGVGARLGSGKQWMSWVHLTDLVEVFVKVLSDKQLSGAINAVSPSPVKNSEFTQALVTTLGRFQGPPVPQVVLKWGLGEMSQVLLASQRVQPRRLLEAGFKFKYAQLQEALSDLLKDQEGSKEGFYAEQFLPLPIDKVFPFFADAYNLEKITPQLLSFKIESVSTPEVQKNTEIVYTLKVHGIPMRWRTDIAEWNPPHQFVDNQLSGPYKCWHHTHSFVEVPGGTLMIDRVKIQLPMGYLGWIVARLPVLADVTKIFSYRRKSIFSYLK